MYNTALWCFYYSAPDKGVEYSDEHVCLCVLVCVFVCLSAIIFSELHVRSSPIFLSMFLIAVARSSSGGVVMSYVLPVLWMINIKTAVYP